MVRDDKPVKMSFLSSGLIRAVLEALVKVPVNSERLNIVKNVLCKTVKKQLEKGSDEDHRYRT